MNLIKKLLATILSLAIVLPTSAMVMAEDADVFELVGSEAIYKSSSNSGGSLIPYSVTGLKEGDSVDWSMKTSSTLKAQTTYSTAKLVANPYNPGENRDTSGDPVKSGTELLVNGTFSSTATDPYSVDNPTFVITAKIIRGGEIISTLTKNIYMVFSSSTKAEMTTRDDISNWTSAKSGWYSGTELLFDENNKGFLRNGTDGRTDRYLYDKNPQSSQQLAMQKAFSTGVYTINYTARINPTIVANGGKGFGNIVTNNDKWVYYVTASRNNGTGYDKFRVGAYWLQSDPYYLVSGWHDVKMVVNPLEGSVTTYIDGIYFNTESYSATAGDPIRTVSFNADVRYFEIFSGYSYSREISTDAKKVIMTNPNETINKTLTTQVRLPDYVFNENDRYYISGGKTDMYSTAVVEAPNGVTVDAPIPATNTASQSIFLSVPSNTESGRLALRMNKTINLLYGYEYITVKNYLMNFENGIPSDISTSAAVATGENGKYLASSEEKPASLTIVHNSDDTLRADINMGRGTLSLKNKNGDSTFSLTKLNDEISPVTVFLNYKDNTYCVKSGTDSTAGVMSDGSFDTFCFMAPVSLVNVYQGDVPPVISGLRIDTQMVGEGILSATHDKISDAEEVRYAWYASDNGVDYQKIDGETSSALSITDELRGKLVKSEVSAVINGVETVPVYSLPVGEKTVAYTTLDTIGGTASAKAYVVSGDVNQKTVNACVAIYNGVGALVNVSLTDAKIENGTYTLYTSLDGFGEGYTAKAFAFNNNLAPLN